MDKFINSKWTGDNEVNSSILDYSLSYNLVNADEFKDSS